jgi:hypothetical protein
MPRHLHWTFLITFVSGVVPGATAMIYLVNSGIVQPDFNPLPLVLGWLFVVASWLLGRAIGVRGRKRGNTSGCIGEDRTPIELFVASVREWDTGLRRFLDHLTDVK